MIFRKTLRDEIVKSLVLLAVVTFALTLAILYYPTFAQNRGPIAKLIPVFVKGMVADVLRDEYVGYFVFQHYVKGLVFLSAAAAVFIGMGAVSKEVETGTISVLLAKPVGRTRVLIEKCAALAIAVSIPVVGSSLLGIPLSLAIGERVAVVPTLAASVHASLSALALLSVTILSSVLFDEQVKAGGYAGVVMLGEMVLFLVDDTRRYSFFNLASYGSYRRIFVDGSYPFGESAILALIAAFGLFLALVAFRRKDL